MREAIALLVCLCACTTVESEEDLDFEDLADDPAAEPDPVDPDSSETEVTFAAGCVRQRFLHIANWSYVADLTCAGGVCKNACWGYQRRTSGFACDYASTQSDRVATRDGGAAFASYNEIKPLNASDGTAVANCKAQSGGHPLRTYVVWNGAGWNREGITATLHFAELYGTQSEASPRFWTWYDGYRDSYAPMANVSPETYISGEGVTNTVKRMCATTRNGWLGLYFYDGAASGGPGMAEWKRAAIIRAMNYCTTH